MSSALRLEDIFSAKSIELVKSAKTFSSDSRKINSQTIFVARKGSTTDGHQYINQDLLSQVSCVVASTEYSQSALGANFKTHPKFIFVEDTHQAHRAIAKYFRSRFSGKIIGIGGSAGKTTTKEFLFSMLSSKFRCFKTEKSQNGDLGIPKTLEQLNDEMQIGIVEIGIDAPGDMSRHWDIVRPDIAVLVSIGEEHLNLLKTIENVFQEEKVLFDQTLQSGGIAFAPETDEYLKTYSKTPGVTLTSSHKSSIWGLQNLPSEIQVQNACLAAEVAKYLGVTDSEINLLSNRLSPSEGRGVVTQIRDHIIIEDHYNSNPSSLTLAVRHFQTLSMKHPTHQKVLVIGDMLDLGEKSQESHRKLSTVLAQTGANAFFLVGQEFSSLKSHFEHICPNVYTALNATEIQTSLGTYLRKVTSPLIILFKGSRGMKLETSLTFAKNLLRGA